MSWAVSTATTPAAPAPPRVDRDDAGVGMRAAHKDGMQHAGPPDVGHKTGRAAQQLSVLKAPCRLAESLGHASSLAISFLVQHRGRRNPKRRSDRCTDAKSAVKCGSLRQIGNMSSIIKDCSNKCTDARRAMGETAIG